MTDERLEGWIQHWREKEKEIAKTPDHKSEMRTSYYSGLPASQDYETQSEPDADWRDIYYRSINTADQLMTDSVSYLGSFGGKNSSEPNKLSSTGKELYTNNPIHFASAGPDQEDEKGKPRVTDNWTDGEDLKELDELKKQVEAIERKYHEAEVLRQKNKSNLEKELTDLRSRIREFGEKVTSNPQSDLT